MTINGKVTLAVLGIKVDQLTASIDKLVDKFDEHVKEDLEVAKIVDRLDQTEGRRTWHIRALWAAMLSWVISKFWS